MSRDFEGFGDSDSGIEVEDQGSSQEALDAQAEAAAEAGADEAGVKPKVDEVPETDSIEVTSSESEDDDDPEGDPEKEAKPDANEPSADDRAEAKEKRKQNKIQKRFDKLTAKNGELGRENAELRKKLAEHEKPEPEDYDDLDDYEEDLKNWEAKTAEIPEADSNTAVLAEAYEDIMDDADDWDDKPEDFDYIVNETDFPMSEATLVAISELDNPAAVLYHIGKNEDVASRLSRTRTEARLVERLDKISKSLVETPAEPTPKKQSQRKRTAVDEPIAPLGGDTPPAAVDLNNADFADYERIRNEQDRGSGVDPRFM